MTLTIDFTQGAIAHRAKYGGGKQQLLAKACGLHKHAHLNILDITAGLGQDAFILATLGAKVTLLERHPTVYEALKKAIAAGVSHNLAACEYMTLIHTNSLDYLNHLNADLPDVIYCDPMYPHSPKSRLVKKNMRDLRQIVGDDPDAKQLVSASLEKATYRVVIKRPKHAPALSEHPCQLCYQGKSSRFDVYLPNSFQKERFKK